MEQEPESIELNRRLNPAGETRILKKWGHVSINKQHLILDDGSPMGILPIHRVEPMPVSEGEDGQAGERSLVE